MNGRVPSGPSGERVPDGPAPPAPSRTGTSVQPSISCPFPRQVNGHLGVARRHLRHWVRRYGLVRNEAARQRFARADFGWFAAAVYPAADRRGLCLMADWFAWLFLLDDQLDDGGVGRDLDRAREVMAELFAVLHDVDGARPEAARPPIVVALADLWRRTLPHATPAWRRRFVGHVVAGGLAACWEAENRIRGIVPGEAAYITSRRDTGAIYVCMDLIEIAERIAIPAAVYDEPLFQEALAAACDVVCWTNDVYSLGKEAALGECHNLVTVVEHARGLTREAALSHVVAAVSQRLAIFLDREGQIQRVPSEHRVEIAKYLAGMRSWMRGNLDWSAQTSRYRRPGAAEAESPADYVEPALAALGGAPESRPPGARQRFRPSSGGHRPVHPPPRHRHPRNDDQ